MDGRTDILVANAIPTLRDQKLCV